MGSQCLTSLLSSVSLPSTLPASPLRWWPCAIMLNSGRRRSEQSCSQLKQAAPEIGDTPPGELGLKLCRSKNLSTKINNLSNLTESIQWICKLWAWVWQIPLCNVPATKTYKWWDMDAITQMLEKTAKTDPVWWMWMIDTVTLYEQTDTTAMAWRIQWNQGWVMAHLVKGYSCKHKDPSLYLQNHNNWAL